MDTIFRIQLQGVSNLCLAKIGKTVPDLLNDGFLSGKQRSFLVEISDIDSVSELKRASDRFDTA